LALILAGCAQQVTPTGGDRDMDAPRILSAKPDNESTNMLDNKIILEFDEYVALKNANQELIVSPPLKYPVEFKMKNKKLQISWRDTLLENTTYLFQFGKGIADVNENNVLDSNIFVFSTGPYLDSFEVSGKVIDAFDLKPLEEVWVMLYDADIDSLPLTELPRYFSKTDASGNFYLKYLRPGNYKIFALSGKNGGYLYDAPGEGIAFLEGMISATNPSDSIAKDTAYALKLFVEEDSIQYVKSFVQVGNTGLIVEFNRAVEGMVISELTGIEDVKSWTESWSLDHDSVTYWFEKPNEYDSLKLRVEIGDFSDTIFFRKPSGKMGRAKGGKGGNESKGLTLSSSGARQLHYKPMRMVSKTPLASMDKPEEFVFIEDKDTIDVAPYIKKEFYALVLDYPWKQSSKYKLIIPDSLVADRFGVQNDSLIFSFVASRKEDFGQLYFSHSLPELGHKFIWQLMKGDDVVDERIVEAKGKVKYEYLPTGSYRVRLLYDANDNGQWDTGYYKGKRQPEIVKYFHEAIDVRSNWATEIEWNLKK
jgi:hypothetical protein